MKTFKRILVILLIIAVYITMLLNAHITIYIFGALAVLALVFILFMGLWEIATNIIK